MSLYFKILQEFRKKVDVDDHAYYPQFRIEPRVRDADNDNSLAMRTADPLWMLGRQWQFGEFKGENNGSPISYTISYRTQALPYFQAQNGEPVHMNGKPLEVAVEAMEVVPRDLRSQAKAGEQLKRIMSRRGVSNIGSKIRDLIDSYPLDPIHLKEENATSTSEPPTEDKPVADAKSLQFFKAMEKKAINGMAIIDEVKDKPASEWNSVLRDIESPINELLAWFRNLYVQPQGKIQSWKRDQLIHKFSIQSSDNAAPTIRLNAPDYRMGNLDWYSFDKAEVSQLPDQPKRINQNYPMNLGFAGMPTKRLFSFEDNSVDLGSVDIQEDDLIRLMILDFSLVSGSDWYTIPLELNVGEVCWIDEIVVKDVFGIETTIKNGGEDENRVGPSLALDVDGDNKPTGLDVWDVFKIRDHQPKEYIPKDHFLYIPPVVSGRQESEPLEEILFLRDEFSNMVWGIEKRVLDHMGKATDAYDLHLEYNQSFQHLPEHDRLDPDSYPKFRLASSVPYNWIPYIPNPNKPGSLRRAFMVSIDPNNPLVDILPLSLLAGEELLDIREEAIPRAGVRVQITRQRIRWTNGKTFIWQGRKVLTGRGGGNSGLQFDYLE